MHRGLGRIDAGMYARAIGVLARRPSILLGPLGAGLIITLLNALSLLNVSSGGDNPFGFVQGGIVSILDQIIEGLGLGLAIAVADYAWRGTRTPFEDGLDSWKRRFGAIGIASLGFNFVVYVAGMVGGFLGPLSLILELLAIYFLIFTIPAATIGGIPGGAALQISIDRVNQNKLAGAIATLLYIVCYGFGTSRVLIYLGPYVTQFPIPHVEYVLLALQSLVQAIFFAYLGTVLAKSYGDISYGRFF